MISTTKLTKEKTIIKIIKTILIATFWILVWEAASRLVSRDNELLLLILPGPITVFKKWIEIAFTTPFLKATFLTLARIFLGFFLGVIFGFLLGVVTHISKLVYSLLSPILKMIRAVPVVAIIILMYLFFTSTTLPILIVCLMVMPLVWQTVFDGLNNVDIKLLEMANAFNLSSVKTFFNIKLPHILPSLFSSCINALGLAWKSGVAAEVICLPDISLGSLLWQGKGAVNYDEVYAVTLTVIFLSLVIEILLKSFLKGGIVND